MSACIFLFLSSNCHGSLFPSFLGLVLNVALHKFHLEHSEDKDDGKEYISNRGGISHFKMTEARLVHVIPNYRSPSQGTAVRHDIDMGEALKGKDDGGDQYVER